jgi:hypothetical protein
MGDGGITGTQRSVPELAIDRDGSPARFDESAAWGTEAKAPIGRMSENILQPFSFVLDAS